MNAFGLSSQKDLVSRADFVTVFTPKQKQQIQQSRSQGKLQASGKKEGGPEKELTNEQTKWIKKLNSALLEEGISAKVAFKNADVNLNEVITIDELREAIKKLIPEEAISLVELKNVMMALDLDRNGLIEEHEFIRVLDSVRDFSGSDIAQNLSKGANSKEDDFKEDRKSKLPMKDSKRQQEKTGSTPDDA